MQNPTLFSWMDEAKSPGFILTALTTAIGALSWVVGLGQRVKTVEKRIDTLESDVKQDINALHGKVDRLIDKLL